MKPIIKAKPSDAGCWLDSARGAAEIGRLVIAEALTRGWEDKDAQKLLDALRMNDNIIRDQEAFFDTWDDAEKWLNEMCAPEGFYFGSYEDDWDLWEAGEAE